MNRLITIVLLGLLTLVTLGQGCVQVEPEDQDDPQVEARTNGGGITVN